MDSQLPKPKVVLNQESIEIKIIVIGNSATGKTSFCSRWTKDEFKDEYKATITSDFSFKMYEHNSKFYKIFLWDIAGQDKNIHLSKVFGKNSHGCLIVSDITNPDTREATLKWKKEIDTNNRFIDGNEIPCLLIQNKIDLIENEDSINKDEAVNFAKENGYINSFYTSAKTGYGVSEAMNFLLENIIERLENYVKTTGNPITTDRKSIVVQQTKTSKESLFGKKSCSC